MHDQKDLSGLLQMLFDIAWQHEIKIDKTTPQSEVAGNEVVRYPIVLEMNTSYHQLGNFISSLERIPHILRIDRLALTLEKTGNIKAHMRVTCFANRTGEQ
jgi:Tfp pilus assembly protein PilO